MNQYSRTIKDPYPKEWGKSIGKAREVFSDRFGGGPYIDDPQKTIAAKLRGMEGRYDTGNLTQRDKDQLKRASQNTRSIENFIGYLTDEAINKQARSKR